MANSSTHSSEANCELANIRLNKEEMYLYVYCAPPLCRRGNRKVCFKEQVGEVVMFYAMVVSGLQRCFPGGRMSQICTM